VGQFRYFGARLVEAAGVEPGDRVLDVATGRGAVLFPAAERVGPTGEVTGIDLSPEMVRLTGADLALGRLPGQVLVMQPVRRLDRRHCAERPRSSVPVVVEPVIRRT